LLLIVEGRLDGRPLMVRNYDGAHRLDAVILDGKRLYGTTQQGGIGG
jgi:hypothetical protein